jgi:glycosyltransferase involved in cell wall biosynthesis
MQILDGVVHRNDTNANSNGGSELITEKLATVIDKELLSKFQIIVSRVKHPLRDDRIRILFLHDLADDPETHHLANGGWKKFHKLVFVSNWQCQQYISRYQIPWHMTHVLRNAIEPIDVVITDKPKDVVNVIYHTTPHRGLELLVPIFEQVVKNRQEGARPIHLHTFSSFKMYGWEQRDVPYQKLFKTIDDHPNMTNHGFVDNSVVREQLAKSHIFAYPSVWPETSCISLIEAMSAGCRCIHPSLGALFETSACLNLQYNFDERPEQHAKIHMEYLTAAIKSIEENSEGLQDALLFQKMYTDSFYSWNGRARQWTALLNNLVEDVTELSVPQDNEPVFRYKPL